jgi:hypothetical protein
MRFIADPLSDLSKLPPLFGEKGEPEPDLPKFGRGLGECEPCSWALKLLLRGVDR